MRVRIRTSGIARIAKLTLQRQTRATQSGLMDLRDVDWDQHRVGECRRIVAPAGSCGLTVHWSFQLRRRGRNVERRSLDEQLLRSKESMLIETFGMGCLPSRLCRFGGTAFAWLA